MMNKIIGHLIDFIFPPSETELRLRDISPIDFYINITKSGATEFPFIKAVFSYKDPLVRELIWQIKYKKNKHSIKCAGLALYNELLKIPEEITLVPIPLSKNRFRERGYNQCELIIDEIIKLNDKRKFNKNYDLLIRNRNIDKQTFKNRNERIVNTKDIFQVKNKEDVNRKIIIIDDVSTTGSTLKEAREALLNAGFTSVEALTIAH